MKAFARVIHVNIRFYRLPYTKPTFRLPSIPAISLRHRGAMAARSQSSRSLYTPLARIAERPSAPA